MKLIAPNGLEIIGRLEIVPGIAQITGDVRRFRNQTFGDVQGTAANGAFLAAWSGETKILWNDQRPIFGVRDGFGDLVQVPQIDGAEPLGALIWIDTEGNQWLETELRLT